jgi:CheY-like chemotaxis protein
VSSDDDSTDRPAPDCPYCGRPVLWIPNRWFGRGCFHCEHCGDFADFRSGAAANARPHHVANNPAAAREKGDARLRVLLVDDSSESRDLYAMMLEDVARVVTASRGEDALVMAGAEPPDAIILDVMMPGLDGWRVCQCLRGNPVTARIPVIMLTSVETADVSERARAAGADAVLIKPCPVERLVETLNASMRRAGSADFVRARPEM